MIMNGGQLRGSNYKDQNQVVTNGLTMWLDAGNPARYSGRSEEHTSELQSH